MKKLVSFVLLGSMALSAGAVFGETADKLDKSKIDVLCENNIIKGRENGLCLENKITKAEALAMILRATGEEKSVGMEYRDIIGQVSEIDEDGIVIKNDEEKVKVDLSMAVIKGKEKDEIKVGDNASAVISTQMTKSIPPMANATVLNISDKASVSYFEVAKVEKIDNGYMIYDKNNSYIIAAADDTNVTPYLTRNIMKMDDISEGDKLAVISEVMTMSLPPMMNPTEIIVIENNFSNEECNDIDGHWAKGDIEYSLKKGYISANDGKFAPDSEDVSADFVNTVLEKMGVEVTLSDINGEITRGDVANLCYNIIKS